ncbi:hypothetical protein GCM10010166_61470 [Couchioplanes caeruleus subsp. azureus]|nr:hypothetical protein GCM10010166_61470 [Couchioplanes caeruleus subsp. azureus]
MDPSAIDDGEAVWAVHARGLTDSLLTCHRLVRYSKVYLMGKSCRVNEMRASRLDARGKGTPGWLA